MFTLTLILAVGVAGCGGSSQDRLSKDDTTVIADALDGAVQVVQTAAPVLACDAATCNRAALERLRVKATRIATNLDRERMRISDTCARDGLRSYVKAIRAYATYAADYERHQQKAGDAALDLADTERTAAAERWTACGLMKRGESVGLAFSEAYTRIDRAASGLSTCQAIKCLIRAGHAIDKAATKSLSELTPLVAKTKGPPCFLALANVSLRYIKTAAQIGKAAEKLDVQRLQVLAGRYTKLQTEIAVGAKACAAWLQG
jgi:hypothetical protein